MPVSADGLLSCPCTIFKVTVNVETLAPVETLEAEAVPQVEPETVEDAAPLETPAAPEPPAALESLAPEVKKKRKKKRKKPTATALSAAPEKTAEDNMQHEEGISSHLPEREKAKNCCTALPGTSPVMDPEVLPAAPPVEERNTCAVPVTKPQKNSTQNVKITEDLAHPELESRVHPQPKPEAKRENKLALPVTSSSTPSLKYSHFNFLANSMIITDVTTARGTVTVKECSAYEGFF